MRRLASLALALAMVLALVPLAGARSKTISLRPKTINPGARSTIFGSGWKGKVTLLVGPADSEADKVGTTKGDSDGEILYQGYVVPAGTPEGTYVLLACQQDCKVKVSSRFTVKRTVF